MGLRTDGGSNPPEPLSHQPIPSAPQQGTLCPLSIPTPWIHNHTGTTTETHRDMKCRGAASSDRMATIENGHPLQSVRIGSVGDCPSKVTRTDHSKNLSFPFCLSPLFLPSREGFPPFGETVRRLVGVGGGSQSGDGSGAISGAFVDSGPIWGLWRAIRACSSGGTSSASARGTSSVKARVISLTASSRSPSGKGWRSLSATPRFFRGIDSTIAVAASSGSSTRKAVSLSGATASLASFIDTLFRLRNTTTSPSVCLNNIAPRGVCKTINSKW